MATELSSAGATHRLLYARHVKRAYPSRALTVAEQDCALPSTGKQDAADSEQCARNSNAAENFAHGDTTKWRVSVENRFPEHGFSAHEEYEFDHLVLTDKLLVFPGEYNLLNLADIVPPGDAALGRLRAYMQGLKAGDTRSRIVLLVAVVTRDTSDNVRWPDLLVTPEGYRKGGRADAGGDVPRIDFVVREGGKPTRVSAAQAMEQYVVYSTEAFAKQHLNFDEKTWQGSLLGAKEGEEEVRRQMQAEFEEMLSTGTNGSFVVGQSVSVMHSSLFVWDHAQALERLDVAQAGEETLTESSIYWDNIGLGLCGDFMTNGKSYPGVDSAASSGISMAEVLAKHLKAKL
eukprot:TRINITY_DN42624_c0_g1_i1.p1 TRINITY_DN42624_c0_g1~~TRINITY_DN42624_c0_g1_i1.p1  ORF type:complete len:378 (-),score=58.22 TRINITY_DN42624_c0_g1_i1:58-1095(-)